MAGAMSSKLPVTADKVQVNPEEYRQARQQLNQMQAESLEARLNLLKGMFSEIVQDAEVLAKARPSLPAWELMFPEQEHERVIEAKYDLTWSRTRPDLEDITPATDILYEASDLLYQKWLTTNPTPMQTYNSVYRQYVQPLEAEHNGQFVAVSPDGELLFGDSLVEVTKQASEQFHKGNFLFKVGSRTIGGI